MSPDTADLVLDLAGTAEVDLVRTCRPMTDGMSDPTWSVTPERAVRAMSTPDGAVTVELAHAGAGLRAQLWGPGTQWLAPRLERFVGAPAPEDFRPELHPVVDRAARRHPGARFGASLRVRDVLVPTILGQRVTAREARRTWWTLVRRLGAPAPGPHGLQLPPEPSLVVRLSDADWHRIGVERQRADAIRRAHAVLGSLERAAERDSGTFQRAVCAVPGLGPWTATGLAASVLGDPDAVLLGDLHLPHHVCFALAGEERGSDERMLELLEPWRGHRARVVRLVRSSGRSAPRRGPKYTLLPIARW